MMRHRPMGWRVGWCFSVKRPDSQKSELGIRKANQRDIIESGETREWHCQTTPIVTPWTFHNDDSYESIACWWLEFPRLPLNMNVSLTITTRTYILIILTDYVLRNALQENVQLLGSIVSFSDVKKFFLVYFCAGCKQSESFARKLQWKENELRDQNWVLMEKTKWGVHVNMQVYTGNGEESDFQRLTRVNLIWSSTDDLCLFFHPSSLFMLRMSGDKYD
jgi:hypothetical protein